MSAAPRIQLLQVPGLAQFGAAAPVCGPDGCDVPAAAAEPAASATSAERDPAAS
jgi:hypothetical protein